MEITNKLPALFHLILDAFLVILIKKKAKFAVSFFLKKNINAKTFCKAVFSERKRIRL